MVRLIDNYGAVLTEKQFSIISNYYFDNLTYAEIGENMGISRQAVSDSINQSIKTMKGLEEKLGLISKFDSMLDDISQVADKMSEERKMELLQVIEKYRR